MKILKKILKFNRLKNPCDECLVQPACSVSCKPKYEYHYERGRLLERLRTKITSACIVCAIGIGLPMTLFVKSEPQLITVFSLFIAMAVVFVGGSWLDLYYFKNKIDIERSSESNSIRSIMKVG